MQLLYRDRDLSFKFNQLELAWLAGILEGEGCFLLTKTNSKKSGKTYFYPRIIIAMTDYDVIARVAQLFDRGINIANNKHTIEQGYQEVYSTSLVGKDAAKMMRILQPHMFGRRAAKIQEILDDPRSSLNKVEDTAV